MAYKGTRGATNAAVAERNEDLQPRTSAELIAMSKGAARSTAAARVRKKPSTHQVAAPHEDDSRTTASAMDDLLRRVVALEIADTTPPPGPRAVDDLRRRVIALEIVDDNNSKADTQIETIPQLKQELEGICRTISATLGRQQKESAYQLALELELQLRGVAVQRETKISITYRDRDISSRRLDLLLTVADGSTAIVEMKAVQTITKGTNLGAVHQLQYYLDVFDVDHGFLVNFPHDTGFPPPPNGSVFRQEPICGVKGPLSDVRMRERKGGGVGEGPEIVYFQRVSP